MEALWRKQTQLIVITIVSRVVSHEADWGRLQEPVHKQPHYCTEAFCKHCGKMRKWENAGKQGFLIFPTMFPTLSQRERERERKRKTHMSHLEITFIMKVRSDAIFRSGRVKTKSKNSIGTNLHYEGTWNRRLQMLSI